MIDTRTRMTNVAHRDGRRIYLAVANEDGVLFAARFLEQAILDTPSSIIMYMPTDQG